MSLNSQEDFIHEARPEVSAILAEHGREGLLDLQESIGMYRDIVEPLVKPMFQGQPEASGGTKQVFRTSNGITEVSPSSSRMTDEQVMLAAGRSVQRAIASSI